MGKILKIFLKAVFDSLKEAALNATQKTPALYKVLIQKKIGIP